MDSTIGIIPAMTNGCCDNDNYTNFLESVFDPSWVLTSNVTFLYIINYAYCLCTRICCMFGKLQNIYVQSFSTIKNRFHLPQVWGCFYRNKWNMEWNMPSANFWYTGCPGMKSIFNSKKMWMRFKLENCGATIYCFRQRPCITSTKQALHCQEMLREVMVYKVQKPSLSWCDAV